jgi:NADH-quinone oxidoreductase subunit C
MNGWRAELELARQEGYSMLDLLTSVDHGHELELVARVVRPDGEARILSGRIAAQEPAAPSVTDLFAAATWYERETAEMFGIEFDGLTDRRPLLRRATLGAPPLRRSTVLAARVALPWPGSAEVPDGRRGPRRRQQPPGVPESWLSDGDA